LFQSYIHMYLIVYCCYYFQGATTPEDVLNAEFQALDKTNPSSSKTTTKSASRSYPEVVVEWKSFDPTKFTLEEEPSKVLNIVYATGVDKTVKLETHLEDVFGKTIGHALNQFDRQIGEIVKRIYLPSTQSCCDEVCLFKDRVYAVQEMKLINILETMPALAEDVAKQYVDGGRKQNSTDPKWCRVVAQTYGYMLDQEVCYGIISCYNSTWFIHVFEAGKIEISNAFTCNSGQLIRAYAYFMKIAKEDTSILAPLDIKQRRRSKGEEPSEDDESSPPDNSQDDPSYSEGNSSNKKRSQSSGAGPSSSSAASRPKRSCTQGGSSSSYSSLSNAILHDDFSGPGPAPCPNPESPSLFLGLDVAPELDLALCCNQKKIGEGRSGLVFSCVHEGTDIAVKLVDCYKGDLKTLEGEKQVYKKLQPFHGKCVPKIVSYNAISRGRTMVGFAMEKLEPLPGDFMEWSDEQRCAAVTALNKLAAVGVFHDDIRGANFGLRHGNEVVVFDFECVIIQDRPAVRYPASFRRALKELSLSSVLLR
jgi:predicted Ser/Thr protein kinase